MRIAIGSDHAGFDLKEEVKAFLIEEKHEVLDLGTHSKDPLDYPDYAEAVGEAFRDYRAERGIMLCGSGVGALMVANRIPGIRAGLCHDTYSARQGVEHDDMNMLVLGGRVVGIEINEAHERALRAIRHGVRDAKRVATCLEFGPRFLHSTGQAYKGGPNSGVFLQITCDDTVDLAVPRQKYMFGVVKAAQARGDFQVLLEHDRRALRAHLGTDVAAGLRTLQAAMTAALAS